MNKLRIHYIQHVSFEGISYIEDWAKQNEVTLTSTKLFEEVSFPNLKDVDWLIIMGGPMGVYDEDSYSWLVEEKRFIKSAIEQGKVVIGICLGAQLIASTLGAKVYPNSQKGIGWFPIYLTEEESSISNIIPDGLKVFHWHGDMFEIPKGAKRILYSEACENQAFLYNDRVLGLQFHLEMDDRGLPEIITNCEDELVDGKYIQKKKDILEGSAWSKGANLVLSRILDHFRCLSEK